MLYDIKPNILGFWTAGHTEQDIEVCLELWKVVMDMFSLWATPAHGLLNAHSGKKCLVILRPVRNLALLWLNKLGWWF